MTIAVLRRTGGSITLSIPKAIAQTMGVDASSSVSLSVTGRTLSVTPAYSIETLLAGLSVENSHELIEAGDRGAERIDW
ncbi:hypothetical protein GLA29479_5179 [Lysobacter antibioticus]|uniref:AbrB/MazE/SpoVT family DNA-binding domain-containing protein n=1 Tax=Lysobacter antibioticus TaxID=84531 RepID=UPI0007206858|nr:antitoxin [Lysobacter antibioticus]ALN66004.1 hypothetical protein GLA29479_5179 [Lysobacter antibioticus]